MIYWDTCSKPTGAGHFLLCIFIDISNAISRKLCKIAGKLVLITDRKTYMSFHWYHGKISDLKRRNGFILRYFTEFGSFQAHCVKVLTKP